MPTGIYTRTEEHRRKISIGVKNNPGFLSVEARHSISNKNRINNLGKKQTLETKIKRGIFNKGEKHPRFLHGLSNDKHWKSKIKKQWIIENRDYVNYINALARARRKCAEGDYSYKDWLDIKSKSKYQCLMCLKFEPVIKLTIDHIIPLSRGGNNKKENIQPLCGNCNSSKGKKIIEMIKGKLND